MICNLRMVVYNLRMGGFEFAVKCVGFCCSGGGVFEFWVRGFRFPKVWSLKFGAWSLGLIV
jgi:hypothetical protein